MTAVANARQGQTDKPYMGEHHTLTKQSMRHQDCPSDTYVSRNKLTFYAANDKYYISKRRVALTND